MKRDTKAVAKELSLSERQVRHLAELGRIPGAERQDTPRGAVWVFRRKPRILAPRASSGTAKEETIMALGQALYDGLHWKPVDCSNLYQL